VTECPESAHCIAAASPDSPAPTITMSSSRDMIVYDVSGRKE
jgi:hypothetical protein